MDRSLSRPPRGERGPCPVKTVRELAFYRCAGPATTPLRELVRVVGARWAIEECLQTAKNEAAWTTTRSAPGRRAWYAHTTLAMLALAYLAATRAREHRNDHEPAGAKGDPGHSAEQLIPLSANEIRRLLAALVLAPITCVEQVLRWSQWRQRRQYQARACHYRRRGHHLPT